MMNKRICILLALLLVLAGCAGGGAENTQPVQTLPPTTPPTAQQTTEPTLALAPDFTVYDMEGNAVNLSDFRGKPVVLNFWASWCGPCKSEMPEFQEAYETYGQQIRFLMVNLTDGTSETVDTVRHFLADTGYTFPVYCDTSGQAASAYGVYSIPTTYFMDAQGHAVAYGTGAMDGDTLARGIEMILPEE